MTTWKYFSVQLFKPELVALILKFILEIEQNGALPYLDVLLIKKHHEIEHTVHRKPIATQSIINLYAQAPFSYKISAFRHSI